MPQTSLHPNGVLLVLTQPDDGTAVRVVEEAVRRGADVVRFDTGEFPLESTLTASIERDARWHGAIRTDDGRTVRFEEVSSVWFRRPTAFRPPAGMAPEQAAFVRQEARLAIGGLLRACDCVWVNHPERIVSADYKPVQLALAAELGLAVPRTLITSDPEAARAFYEDCHGSIVYKTLGGGVTAAGGGSETIATSRVTPELLGELDAVRYTACLFQEYVPKRVEVRVTVIGERVFPVAIDSQATAAGVDDWRLAAREATHRVHELPADTATQLLELNARLGLLYSAIDMIVTPDGDHVFLEVNANGQWGWIEDRAGLPLSSAMADLLLAPVRAAAVEL